jgi:hypothetical protein
VTCGGTICTNEIPGEVLSISRNERGKPPTTIPISLRSQSDFQDNAAPIPSEQHNTSRIQAMHFNDQIGSLKVIGYVGVTNGHLVS